MSIDRINFDEAEYFYKNNSITDFSTTTSLGLIRSCIEILAYYGVDSCTGDDIKEVFQKIGIVQKKNGKVFVPSVRKAEGVLDCFLSGKGDRLSCNNGVYHIEKWDSTGYMYEIQLRNISLHSSRDDMETES